MLIEEWARLAGAMPCVWAGLVRRTRSRCYLFGRSWLVTPLLDTLSQQDSRGGRHTLGLCLVRRTAAPGHARHRPWAAVVGVAVL